MTNPATNRGSSHLGSPRYTFRKTERIRQRRILGALFGCKQECLRIKDYPLLWIWRPMTVPSSYPVQVAFVVGRRRIRKAVQRNAIKRRLRELYRHRKHRLYQLMRKMNQQGALLVIYLAQTPPTWQQLQASFDQGFDRLLYLIHTSNALPNSAPHPILSNGN